MRQVHSHAVDVVGHVGAPLAAYFRARLEHEVLHQELVAAVKPVGERLPAIGPVEDIRLVDGHPGQSLTQPRDVIAAPH